MDPSDLKKLVNSLQDAVAEKLLERVQSDDVAPAEINAAITFLKNNGISVDIGVHKNNSVAKLRAVMPFGDEAPIGVKPPSITEAK